MKASIALQVLPLSKGIDRIAIIDQVIAYLQAQSVTMVGHPLKRSWKGSWMSSCAFSKKLLKWPGRRQIMSLPMSK